MIGDAVPIRFSRRIKKKASLSPVRVSPNRKIRKSAVKKRASGVNSSLLKAKEKTKVDGKNKLEESPKQASKILKRASRNLKPVIRKSPRMSKPKICDKKRKTRVFLKTFQVNLTNNKVSLKNFELFDNSKKVIKKKNRKKFLNEEKQYVRRSLRLSKSLLSPKEKGKNKELSDSGLKPSKKRPSQKKSTKQVTTLSSESVLTPNPENCTHKPKLSGRKNSARLSIEPGNRELSVHMPASKSLAATPIPGKVTPISRHSGYRKSARLSTKPGNQEISVHMPASKSLAVTPVPGKVTPISRHSGNRKSARLSTEPGNQEISVHMPASKSLAVTPVPGKVTPISRHSGYRKSERLSKELNRLRIMNSDMSLYTSSFHSVLETPQPEKHSEKRKSSRSLEPSPLRTFNKELPLSTPASLLTRNPDSTLNKSCKSVELLSSESRSRKQSRPKVSNKAGSTVSHEKRKQKKQVNRHQKTSENFKRPLLNESENLPLDIFTTPGFKPPCGRSLSRKYLSKSDPKSSKRKLNALASENQVANEELQDAKKRKSAGDNVCVDNSTSPSKCRSMEKSICPVKTNHTKKLINNQNFEGYLMPVVNIQGKVDVLTADLFEKRSRRRVGSVPVENEMDCFSSFNEGKGKYIDLSEKQSQKKVKFIPCGNEINGLSSVGERKGKSTGNLKRKPVKRLMSHVISPNVNSALSSNTSTEKTIEKKASPVKLYLNKKHNSYETLQVSSPPVKVDCLTADLYEVKHRRAISVPSKNNYRGLLRKRRTSAFSKKRWIKILAPIKFTPIVNLNTESSLPNSKLKTLFHLPLDDLTTNESASCSQNVDRLVVNMLSPCCISKKETHSWPLGNELSSEISAKDDFLKIPSKGTLKHKRWLLNNLKEKNGSYEDDIFENQNFDSYKPAFYFGDESDGSSVNIATPKFDCILTPALPKKTPRFKDCISTTEFLQARKTAEEYLYRRNKKRKSGDRPSSSGKKTNVNKKSIIVQDIPENKKLDFEEAVNKLIAVQKNLEIEAEVDDEEEDSYFSDVSN